MMIDQKNNICLLRNYDPLVYGSILNLCASLKKNGAKVISRNHDSKLSDQWQGWKNIPTDLDSNSLIRQEINLSRRLLRRGFRN